MAWVLSTCWVTSFNLPVEYFKALSTKWRTPIEPLHCRHKRTGTIQSSTLALGICTDFGGPEDGWNMRHCCERIVASPQVSIAELRGSCLRRVTAGLEYLARKPLSISLEGRTVVEDGLLEQGSKNNFEIYIRLVKCVGDKSWWTKRPKVTIEYWH